MKKLLILFLPVLLLTGCGEQKSSDSMKTETSSSEMSETMDSTVPGGTGPGLNADTTGTGGAAGEVMGTGNTGGDGANRYDRDTNEGAQNAPSMR